MELKDILSMRLAELIKNRGITADKVSKETGLSASMLSDIIRAEDRRINYTVIITLSKYFDVSSDYLLGLSDIKTPNCKKRAVIELLGMSEKAFNNLYEIFSHNVLPDGTYYHDSVPDDLQYFLENTDVSLGIIGLIHEYLFADFDNLYYYESSDTKARNILLVPTDRLRLPMKIAEWADDPADPVSIKINKEYFSEMLMQIIIERIKEWRKKAQEQLKKKEAKK